MARRWLSKVTAVINRLLPSQAASRFGTAGLLTEAFKSASWKVVPRFRRDGPRSAFSSVHRRGSQRTWLARGALSRLIWRLSSVPFWGKFTIWYRVPPSPLCPQNPESKRHKFRLCARSLSFKELHAKSREHGSYADGVEARGSNLGTRLYSAGTQSRSLSLLREPDCQRPGIILQIMYRDSRLSVLQDAVNKKQN
jgi:hypothetical protein